MKLIISSFFLLMTSQLYAIALPNNAKIENISDFSGGLDSVTPSHKLASPYSPYMRNVFVDNGTLEAPGGMTVLGSSIALNKVTGIFPYVRENGQTTFLVTDSSITIETANFTAWTFVSSGSNTGSLLKWKQVRNKMWGFNGVDFPITWDGTTKSIMDGTKGFPSVPKFKYLVYDQDRVWGFSAPNAASDGYFSSVVTTDNVIIAPDDNRAWPSINNLKIGQGDGTIVTAAWVFQGQVRVAKERSIYTIFGNTPSSYKPVKEETSIGVVSDESVVVMDGEAHFLGQDGIYRNVQRVSDLIESDVDSMNKGVTNIVQNSWETKIDFEKGNFFGTTATASGLLTLPPGNMQAASPSPFADFAIPGGSTLNDSTTFYGPIRYNFLQNITGLRVFLSSYAVAANRTGCSGNDSPNIATFVYNLFTGVEHSTVSRFIENGSNHPIFFSSQAPVFDWKEVNVSSLAIKYEWRDGPAGCGSTLGGVTAFTFTHASTAQFISDIATNTSITAWGNFDSLRNTNGGIISYYLRTATSPVNVSTRVWVSVPPGSIIGQSLSENYVQWAATLTSISAMNLTPSDIDNVTISHIEGQSSDARAFAIDWKNRYWLAVTTTSDNTKRVIYVKSKTTNSTPNAWMPIEGMNVACFARVGDVLYGGSPSTGTVFRLDYGTSYINYTTIFNVTPIHSMYDTPDMVLGDNYGDKDLYRILVDGEKSMGAILNLQYSLNQRSFISKSFSITGTGRYSKIVEGLRDNGNFKTLRIRLENSQLDKTFIVNNLAIIYAPTSVLTDK